MEVCWVHVSCFAIALLRFLYDGSPAPFSRRRCSLAPAPEDTKSALKTLKSLIWPSRERVVLPEAESCGGH